MTYMYFRIKIPYVEIVNQLKDFDDHRPKIWQYIMWNSESAELLELDIDIWGYGNDCEIIS